MTATNQCGVPTPSRKQIENCTLALVGEAELLERDGRIEQAMAAYAAIRDRTGGQGPASSLGMFRAGRLAYQAGDPGRAADYLWTVVVNYPDEGAAGDAVAFVVERTRRTETRALWAQLSRLYSQLQHRDVADNLLWWLAELAEHELDDPIAARTLYDRIAADYPNSGLIDDARWRSALLARDQGDFDGAITRLRALLATREVSFGVGSYFSVWLDDAQLLLGHILRDDLHQPRAAERAYDQLVADYPRSILVDDALDALATTALTRGDIALACRASARLLAHDPESKYAELAQGRRHQHHCENAQQ